MSKCNISDCPHDACTTFGHFHKAKPLSNAAKRLREKQGKKKQTKNLEPRWRECKLHLAAGECGSDLPHGHCSCAVTTHFRQLLDDYVDEEFKTQTPEEEMRKMDTDLLDQLGLHEPESKHTHPDESDHEWTFLPMINEHRALCGLDIIPDHDDMPLTRPGTPTHSFTGEPTVRTPTAPANTGPLTAATAAVPSFEEKKVSFAPCGHESSVNTQLAPTAPPLLRRQTCQVSPDILQNGTGSAEHTGGEQDEGEDEQTPPPPVLPPVEGDHPTQSMVVFLSSDTEGIRDHRTWKMRFKTFMLSHIPLTITEVETKVNAATHDILSEQLQLADTNVASVKFFWKKGANTKGWRINKQKQLFPLFRKLFPLAKEVTVYSDILAAAQRDTRLDKATAVTKDNLSSASIKAIVVERLGVLALEASNVPRDPTIMLWTQIAVLNQLTLKGIIRNMAGVTRQVDFPNRGQSPMR
jgi:hypothetical protein